jgi:hypothetical protein
MGTIKDIINYYNEVPNNLNWAGLEKIMSEYNIQVKNFPFRAAGMAFNNKIYIDSRITSNVTSKQFYFIILHEIAHNKRNRKYNIDEELVKLSKGDFEVFFEYVINEEIIADRYAKQLYYYLNNEVSNYDQRLHQPIYKSRYRDNARQTYNMLPNTLEEFETMLTKMFN